MDSFKYKHIVLMDDKHIENQINTKSIEICNYAQSNTVLDSAKKGIKFIKKTLENGPLLSEVIYTDLRMPLMNGFEFLEELKELPNFRADEMKRFVLTSSLDPTDFRRVKENPLVSKFIGKPLTMQTPQEI